jgi:hypothetical protein
MTRAKRARNRRPTQLGMVFRTWGGARRGAGRKPKQPRSTPHRARPPLASRFPVHVTLKIDAALPSLRTQLSHPHIKECLRRGKERAGFRLVHYSIQTHHLHLVAEALSGDALSHGIRGLSVRLARRINGLLGRRGRVFVDRYFARVLKTPRQTRSALAYVLLNARRHAAQRGQTLAWNWVDTCSSGPRFDGWKDRRPRPPPDDEPSVAPPRTWLLSVGWKRHGLIPVNAVPGELSER